MTVSSYISRCTTIRISTLVMALLALNACSEDNARMQPATDSRISFEVTSGDEAGLASRSSAVTSLPTVTLTSSSDSLYLIPQVRQGIESTHTDGSRGTLLDKNSIASAGVFAIINTDGPSPFYMYNVAITADNNWTPVNEYLWPGDGSLHITAYSPYRADTSDTEGIVSIPSTDDISSQTISFVTPTAVGSQFDLMYADPVDASASPCQLVMHHALTAVKFVTGSMMSPCTITAITLSGINSRGTLDITTGEWDDTDTPANFTVTPSTELTSAVNSQYVAPETLLTPADSTFILLPQTLDEDAEVTLTIDNEGTTSVFTASLKGQVWTAGTTVIYHLSVSPAESGLILEVTDSEGNQLSSISSPYTGDTLPFTVRSYYTSSSSDADATPVEWRAQLINSDGTPLTTNPEWIGNFTATGSGKTDATLTTLLKEPVFLAMSSHTEALRANTDINTLSGFNPYNLSSSTGNATVENTANSYLINASGTYSLPLVYGNAVKEGTINESSYISTLANNTRNKKLALMHFINHLGNEITSPYIYSSTGCTPAGATLVWEDRINLIRNVRLSDDRHSIVFDVPAASLRQGNAIVAVTDTEGDIMWSWHLWFTDYNPSSNNLVTVSGEGSTSQLYKYNMGRIFGGDSIRFDASSITLRLTQINTPDDTQPLTVDIAVTQEGKVIVTHDCYTFYQWGRQDPMVTGNSQYYDASHREISAENMPVISMPSTHKEMVETSILHPDKFITGDESLVRRLSPFYSNLWNIDEIITSTESMQNENVKTIYDPCPAGAKVSIGNAFTLLTKSPVTYTYDPATFSMIFTLSDGSTLSFATLGYRSPTGEEKSLRGTGESWTAAAHSGTTARYISCGSQGSVTIPVNDILYGFGLRPEADNR